MFAFSGGLLLKSTGRVGEAAIYGAGTWADERVAISVSGQGELIIKSALARTVAEAVEDAGDDADVLDILQRVLVDGFYSTCIRFLDIHRDLMGYFRKVEETRRNTTRCWRFGVAQRSWRGRSANGSAVLRIHRPLYGYRVCNVFSTEAEGFGPTQQRECSHTR